MRITWKTAPIVLCGVLLFVIGTAGAQTTNVSDLDDVFIFGPGKIAEVDFGASASFTPFPGNDGSYSSCTLTALDGLFCLDYKTILNWEDIADPGKTPETVVECTDPSLGLDGKKDNTCTAITADGDGNVWVGGKEKGKAYNLTLLMEMDPDCPSPDFAAATPLALLGGGSNWCGFEIATGRPLLADLAAVDELELPGKAAQKAILGLEGGKAAVAYLEYGEIVEIAGGKSDWGFVGPEIMQAVALFQAASQGQTFILSATSKGRVLAWDIAGTGPAVPILGFATDRQSTAGANGTCPSMDSRFDLSVSATTGVIYLSDNENCQVTAYAADFTGGLMSLVETGEYTSPTVSTEQFTPLAGVTVAPGNLVNLEDCDDPDIENGCAIAADNDGAPAAWLAGVQLADESASGIAMFQIEDIPDCRWIPEVCVDILGLNVTTTAVDALINDDVIVPLELAAGDTRDPEINAAAQRLNITPLLPAELLDYISGDVPDLLLAHYNRGREDSGFYFGGLFGVVEDGVVFRETFEGRYDVDALSGNTFAICDDEPGKSDWVTLATISDRYISANDDYAASDPQYVSTVINNGCGSRRTIGGNWSFKPYDLELTPCTFNPDLNDNWADDGGCTPETADDAVNAKLTLQLADEFKRTVEQLACIDVDDNEGVPPLGAFCGEVSTQIDNVIDKLDKCWFAATDPMNSSGDRTCNAASSQLQNLVELLDTLGYNGTDKANRLGELKARAKTMQFVFETFFMPSLLNETPDGYFLEPQ